jgi:hypothetical protein
MELIPKRKPILKRGLKHLFRRPIVVSDDGWGQQRALQTRDSSAPASTRNYALEEFFEQRLEGARDLLRREKGLRSSVQEHASELSQQHGGLVQTVNQHLNDDPIDERTAVDVVVHAGSQIRTLRKDLSNTHKQLGKSQTLISLKKDIERLDRDIRSVSSSRSQSKSKVETPGPRTNAEGIEHQKAKYERLSTELAVLKSAKKEIEEFVREIEKEPDEEDEQKNVEHS